MVERKENGVFMREDETTTNKSKVYFVKNRHGDVIELRNTTDGLEENNT